MKWPLLSCFPLLSSPLPPPPPPSPPLSLLHPIPLPLPAQALHPLPPLPGAGLICFCLWIPSIPSHPLAQPTGQQHRKGVPPRCCRCGRSALFNKPPRLCELSLRQRVHYTKRWCKGRGGGGRRRREVLEASGFVGGGWTLERTLGSVLEPVKPTLVQVDGRVAAVELRASRAAWVARERPRAPEPCIFRLQVLHPPGVSSSRAAASQWCQPWRGDGSRKAVQPPGSEGWWRRPSLRSCAGIGLVSSLCW